MSSSTSTQTVEVPERTNEQSEVIATPQPQPRTEKKPKFSITLVGGIPA